LHVRKLIPLLAACSAIGSIGNFFFLPALPAIADDFQVDAAAAQLTVTAYLVAFSFGVLLSGPAADRYGRRPLLIGGLLIAAAGALAGWFSESLAQFVLARVVQGVGGGVGITVARASVGDVFKGGELARMYAILTLPMVLGTSLAPYAGGVITAMWDWKVGLLVLTGAALLLAALCARWLPETRAVDADVHGFGTLWRESRALIVRAPFLGYVLTAALIYSLFLVFVTIAPHVMEGALRMSADSFGRYYLLLAGGFFLGNLQVTRAAEGVSPDRVMFLGLALQLGGALLPLGFVLSGLTHPMYVFGPMVLLSFGQGLTLPNVVAHGIQLAPNYSGVASSLFGFAQLAISAVAVQLMGFAPTQTWLPALGFGVIASAVALVALAMLVKRQAPLPA
jgi:MFS transporter, DHA1 family, multidrug resistance protein